MIEIQTVALTMIYAKLFSLRIPSFNEIQNANGSFYELYNHQQFCSLLVNIHLRF